MADLIVDDGRNFIEDVSVDASAEVLDTVAVGDGTDAPSSSDSSLQNQLYSNDKSASNVTLDTTGTTGEIRATITVTGGTEVPGGSDLTEFGLLTDSSTFVYYEVRATPITVETGETKTVEILLDLDSENIDSTQVVTYDGLDRISEIMVGNSSDYVNTIAVGDSTTSVSQSDTGMFSELFRATDSDSEVTVGATSNVGDVDARITLSAGSDADDELSDGDDITEFGVITNSGILVIHEVRSSAVTFQAGDSQTFKIPYTYVN